MAGVALKTTEIFYIAQYQDILFSWNISQYAWIVCICDKNQNFMY